MRARDLPSEKLEISSSQCLLSSLSCSYSSSRQWQRHANNDSTSRSSKFILSSQSCWPESFTLWYKPSFLPQQILDIMSGSISVFSWFRTSSQLPSTPSVDFPCHGLHRRCNTLSKRSQIKNSESYRKQLIQILEIRPVLRSLYLNYQRLQDMEEDVIGDDAGVQFTC